jgi:hypothetical protein
VRKRCDDSERAKRDDHVLRSGCWHRVRHQLFDEFRTDADNDIKPAECGLHAVVQPDTTGFRRLWQLRLVGFFRESACGTVARFGKRHHSRPCPAERHMEFYAYRSGQPKCVRNGEPCLHRQLTGIFVTYLIIGKDRA